jgi:hypothetical protein
MPHTFCEIHKIICVSEKLQSELAAEFCNFPIDPCTSEKESWSPTSKCTRLNLV